MSSSVQIIRQPASVSREIARWTTAAVVVFAAHLSIGYAIGNMLGGEPRPDAEEALTVELTPFSVSHPEQEQPDVLQEETAEPVLEEVQQEEVFEETDTEQIVDTPPDEQPVEVETEVAEVQTETVEPDQPDMVTETIETPPAEVVVPKPVKKPVKKVEKPQKLVKKPVKKRVTATDPAKGEDRTKQLEAKAARAPSVNRARWNSGVYAAIARRTRNVGKSGRVTIRFVVNSSGAIVSAGIQSSSGNSALDSAALAMVRKARVPAPPAGLPGSRHPFTIPLDFQ